MPLLDGPCRAFDQLRVLDKENILLRQSSGRAAANNRRTRAGSQCWRGCSRIGFRGEAGWTPMTRGRRLASRLLDVWAWAVTGNADKTIKQSWIALDRVVLSLFIAVSPCLKLIAQSRVGQTGSRSLAW